VTTIDQLLGVGEAWTLVHAANDAWDGNTRYQFASMLPGGHDTEYLSGGGPDTVFIYLEARLTIKDRARLRAKLLRIDGIEVVRFAVLQKGGFRSEPDGC
jgi:hypothetical protein